MALGRCLSEVWCEKGVIGDCRERAEPAFLPKLPIGRHADYPPSIKADAVRGDRIDVGELDIKWLNGSTRRGCCGAAAETATLKKS